jgi:hypothetical protein
MPNASGTSDETASAATGAAGATLCRNCGASVGDGKFCPQCGQETGFRLPTLREFLREAAGRYVALDGRLWRTVLPLVMPPDSSPANTWQDVGAATSGRHGCTCSRR